MVRSRRSTVRQRMSPGCDGVRGLRFGIDERILFKPQNRNLEPLDFLMLPMQIIDIAHPPLSPAEAEAVLDNTLRSIVLSPDSRVVKIIHGYGSSGKGGSLKTVVRNWAYTHRDRIREILDGENLSPFNPVVQSLIASCNVTLSDIGPANEGVTVLWFD